MAPVVRFQSMVGFFYGLSCVGLGWSLLGLLLCERILHGLSLRSRLEEIFQNGWGFLEVVARGSQRQSPISLSEKTRTIQAIGDANKGKDHVRYLGFSVFVSRDDDLWSHFACSMWGCKFVPCPPVDVGVGFSVIKESLRMDEERIKIVVHHSGHFLTDDNDLLSSFGIVASVKELGHMDIKELWYGLGGQSVHPDRLELLTDDKGFMHMLNIARLNDEVHLYVVHNMVETQIIEFIDWAGGEEGYGVDVEVHTEGDAQEGGEVQVEGGEVQVEDVEVQVEGGEVQVEDVEVQVEAAEVHVEDVEVQVEDADVDEVEDGEVHGEVHHVQEPEIDDFEVEDSEGEEVHENESEAESEEEDLLDVNVHCDIGYSKGNVREEHSNPLLESSESTDNENNMHDVRGLSDNEWLLEELISDVEDSEGEEDRGSSKTKFPTFSMPRSFDGYKWENDKKRICVKCLGGKGKCNWYAYCAFRIDVNAWKLRKVVDTHSYSKDFNVKLMTSKWLSQRMENVRENPTMKVMDIRDKVTRKWNVGISRNMAFRARAMAKDKIEGSFHEQYRRLCDYGHELMKTNPGSTIQIKVDNINGEVIFQRFYACLKACKDNFVCCRPIVGLDGCFLKTKYGGELLTVVGRDGNEQMLPIAYAVVELLIEDLGGKDVCAGITFISDQQKGLLAAFQDLLPGVEQRFCEAEMRNIKAINVEAFKYLLQIPPRSRFTPRSQCDTLVNNMSEAFNSVLVYSRSKPIISMLEDIRVYIMNIWAANRTKMTQYQASICPKVWNKFQKESWLGRYWLPRLEEWELKKNDSELRKGGQRKRCGICNELGHNKKGCPQRPTAQSASEQTQDTQGPPTNVPLTQESTVIGTESGPPQQPDPTVLPTVMNDEWSLICCC
ncbi:hypothetical protein V8G54_036356 [Vigna mungo]|uniref:PB1-like domain-containing protein n=1 Tax=Vigna mungo TaxID=3915 RepID=A0AAQ3MGY5_VIGMU